MIVFEMVSVIIPTYKNRGGLIQSINSVLSQAYEKLEVIVVDDNPPESEWRAETERLMSTFLEDPRVKYIKHEHNKNGAAARNTGIKASKGEFIAFLDDDDQFLQHKISHQLDFLQKHPQYDAVYCLACRNGERYGNSTIEGDATKELLMLQTCMFTPTLMFRRNPLIQIQGFDEAFRRHQDYDLLLRFFHAGYKIGCLKEMLCEIGVNAGENSQSGKKLEETKKYFFQKFQPYIEDINKVEPGFRNRVYAKHYAGVFLTHIKTHYYVMALYTFTKFFFLSPSVFLNVVKRSFYYHTKGLINDNKYR